MSQPEGRFFSQKLNL